MGIANAKLIQPTQGGKAFAVADQDVDLGLAFSKAIRTTTRQSNLKRNPDLVGQVRLNPPQDMVIDRCRCGFGVKNHILCSLIKPRIRARSAMLL
jgi:hypothetical protein